METFPSFVKRLSTAECFSNYLNLPHAFCLQHGSRVPCGVKLTVRNGYSVWLDFNKSEQRFEGMRVFYQFLNITGGETLLVQHCRGFEFKVTVFDMFGAEKEYLNMPNVSMDDVTMGNGCWSFLQHLSWGGKITNTIVVPYEFFEREGVHVPPRVYYQVSSGHEIVGSFTDRTNRIDGLVSICNMLDVRDLNVLNMLVFTFDGVSQFVVRGFANSLLETRIGPTVSANGESSEADRTAFQFVIQNFHMLDYEHGVDIPVEYKKLCKSWRKTDYITAYVGMRCWTLEIRHRSDWRRTTINSGWLTFRQDLGLEEDDLCVFEWKNETIRNFNVRIVKNNIVVRSP